MIKKLMAFLAPEPEEVKESLTVPMATAVLFYEIIRADDDLNQQEVALFEKLVLSEFALPAAEFAGIFRQIEDKARESVDFSQFTRTIHENCTLEQKKAILTSLWHLSAADGHVDSHEEHLIRKIADLMHLRHSEYIQIKLAVLGE